MRTSNLGLMNPFGWNCVFRKDHLPKLVWANRCFQSDWIQVTQACKHGFTLWDYSEQSSVFFLRSAAMWLVSTWYDSLCQRSKWLLWPVQISNGMPWCNAGRGTQLELIDGSSERTRPLIWGLLHMWVGCCFCRAWKQLWVKFRRNTENENSTTQLFH